jgi:RNA binding exosome subunit
MKYFNTVTLSVFAKPEEEDVSAIKQALSELVPLSLTEENIVLTEEKAVGFNEQPIHVLSIVLAKEKHANAFLKGLLAKLTDEQKELLLMQKESRLDNDFNFFIRFEKDKWLTERTLVITDSGRCFHIRMNLAVYPARRPDALVLVDKIFKPE